jgi:hypothetical protein
MLAEDRINLIIWFMQVSLMQDLEQFAMRTVCVKCFSC